MTIPDNGSPSRGDQATFPASPQGRRSQRQAQTLTQLITGARNVFARVGVAEATIAQITAEANVGFGTFYLYFKTKDDALHAVLVEGFTALNTQIDGLLRQAREQRQPWEETLKECVGAYLRFAHQNRDLIQIMFAEQTRLQQADWQVFLRFAWRIVQLLRYAQSWLAGTTPPPTSGPDASAITYPLNLLTAMTVATLTRAAIWWLRQHPEESSQEPHALDEVSALVAQFLIAGLAGVLTTQEETIRKDREHGH
jgi:AcrR family transcriptional regulator